MTVKQELLLSPHQKKLWRHGRQGIAQCAITIEPPLPPARLEAALQQISDRHEVFAAGFEQEPGAVYPNFFIDEERSSLRWQMKQVAEEVELQEHIEAAFRREAQVPFDFEQDALLRATLYQSSNFQWLHLCLPSLIADMATLNNCLREMTLALDDQLDDGETLLQYPDFSDWLDELAEDAEAEEGRAYWQQLEAAQTPAIPFEQKIDEQQEWQAERVEHRLDTRLLQAANVLASRLRIDSEHIFYAAWLLLLARLSGENHLLCSRVDSFRKHEDFQDAYGRFARSIPILARVSIAADFSEVAEAIYRQTEEACSWQEYLGENLPVSDGLDFEWSPMPEPGFGDGRVLTMSFQECSAEPFKLKLHLFPRNNGAVLHFLGDQRRFNREALSAIGEMYLQLLQNALKQPKQAVGRLSLIPEKTWNRLLSYNRTEVEFPPHILVQHRFEQQVKAEPQQIALRFEQGQVSYTELNQQVNRLAHYLRRKGLGADDIVGVCLDRSPDLVVALLAVLKCGAAYLPLDTTYPLERLAFMALDAQIPYVLTNQHNATHAAAIEAEILLLDRLDLSAMPSHNPIWSVSPEQLAYVIYTSGSTGKPKGVMIHHLGLINYLLWCEKAYRLEEGKGAALHSPIGFDLTVTSFFSPLISGREILLIGAGDSVENLHQLLQRETDFSLLKITPAHLSLLKGKLQPETIQNRVRTLILGGEALPAEYLTLWRQADPNTLIINEYGPTEAVVGCCVYQVDPQSSSWGQVPIGTPIDNMQMFILDVYLNPVPEGVVGEIYIGGIGLARGYVNRPEVTAGRFIPHPFSKRPGARLYRTGDLAKLSPPGERRAGHPAGTILFLGRNDDQVKINGHRIELGEVETILNMYDHLREAVVTAPRDAQNNRRLVAYIVPKLGTQVQLDELRQFLKKRLPEYMLPSLFIKLDVLPVTANGKIDRKALPSPDKARPMTGGDYVAPRNTLEGKLAEIWQAALDLEQIGIHDNFFSLGGDSIRSVRVAATALERGVSFSVQQLFEYQTIAKLAEYLAGADQEANATFEAARRSEILVTAPFSQISPEDQAKMPEDVEDAYPLGAVQLGMLFEMQITPDSPSAPAYHNVNGFRLRVHLNQVLLQAAVDHVVKRHPTLRTTFHLNGFSQPLQLVHSQARLKVDVVDLRNREERDQQRLIEAFRRRENLNLFDLTKAPLLRFKIFRITNEEVFFILTEPHAIADGWSNHMTLGEIFRTYSKLLKGETLPPAEPLKVAFRDYIRLEREARESQQTRRFWHELIEDRSPTMMPRIANRDLSNVGMSDHKLYYPLPGKLVDELQNLSRKTGCPLKAVLFAAHLKVISLVTGQSELMTGLVVNGRPEVPDGDQLRGLFLNTLPLPFNFSACSWESLIQAAHRAEVTTYPHRRYPLAAMQSERNGSPLFEIGFTYNHFHAVSDVLDSEEIEDLSYDGGDLSRTQFPLMTLFITTPNQKNEVMMLIEYDVMEFTKQQMVQLQGFYLRVLHAMVADSQANHHLQDFLPAEMAVELTRPAEITTRPLQKVQTLHAAFEAHAAKDPKAVAVCFEGTELSYAEINARANRWAHHFIQRGLEPEDMVAIMADRIPETVIGILAILKAGGVYVPLEPRDPRERHDFILADSRARWLLVPPQNEAPLPEKGPEIVMMDEARVNAYSIDNPNLPISADRLAYVLFTSGSTGKPKGSLNTHANVAELLHNTRALFHFDQRDRWSLFHALTFDFTVWELWGPLCHGARLVMVPYWVSRSPEAFLALLRREKITILNQTPSAFRHLMQWEAVVNDASEPLCLRQIIFGGEALDLEGLRPWFKRYGFQQPRLVNMYGITETTVHVTFRPIQAEDLNKVGSSPIGKAFPGVKVHLLNRWMQAVPLETTGEAYVAGTGLSRGYLNRPDLTATRFVPNPFSDQPGARLYRSGDLMRRTTAHDLEYQGRVDFQVKIRGFRIELGEIESSLNAHADILENTVLVREDLPGGRALVAYAVPQQGCEPSSSELREFLNSRLPAHMIPSHIVTLEALPLTINGKIDRRQLPLPERPESQQVTREPKNRTEAILTDIWSEVLGLDKIDVFDNFFELGGDSILCIQIIARIKEFGLRLTPQQLFRYPTIAELTEVIAASTALDIDQGPVSGSHPITPIQSWFFAQDYPDPAHWNIPLLVKLSRTLDLDALDQVFRELVNHHDVLRTRFTRTDGAWQTYIEEPGSHHALEVQDLQALDEAEFGAEIERRMAEMQMDFDLSTGPLMRLVYFKGARDDRLFILIHHLVVDGVSYRIILEDLERGYRRLQEGKPLQFPLKTSSYLEWAERLHAHTAAGHMDDQLSFWTGSNFLHAPALPLDFEWGPNSEESQDSVVASLETEETQTLLKELPVAHQTQINDVLLTALVLAFAKWTGQKSLLIEMEGHGREALFDDLDISRTVGWFTCQYPLCLTVQDPADPIACLKEVKAHLEQVPQKGIAWGMLHYLHPDPAVRRLLANRPHPGLSFNYLGQINQNAKGTSLFQGAIEATGPAHAQSGQRTQILEINGNVFDGKMHFNFNYSKNLHKHQTIVDLAAYFLMALRDLIEASQLQNPSMFDLSEFKDMDMSAEDLEELLEEFGNEEV